MTAYYNEIDPFAAQWLRNLIAAGHIAPGDVDERSIEDVLPSDLRGYTQCHFFAGIGVWSYALRQAGWSDDRPVWTGSCPCQPFSAAGQGAGFDDERHLWPAFHHLIKECKPASILGEQVASKDADPWIDLVHADLEALGYAFGCVPFPSAGVGAPHIRDRNYWVADSANQRHEWGGLARGWRNGSADGGNAGRMANNNSDGCKPRREGGAAMGHGQAPGADRGFGGMADLSGSGRGKEHADARGGAFGNRAQGLSAGLVHGGGAGRLADDQLQQRPDGKPRFGDEHDTRGRFEGATETPGLCRNFNPGPTNGLWADADWLFCRDGKWRPVEPGTFPLAHGAPARVGRLRGFGNAINAIQAQTFIESVMGEA